MLGDGIYDQLSNKEVVDCVWMTFKDISLAKNLHLQCGMAIDLIIKTSLVRRTLDNVTVVLIGFQNFENYFIGQNSCAKADKNYKSTVTDQKSYEIKKLDTNYKSNKETNSLKLKAKISDEDKVENQSKELNTPQNSKSNNTLNYFNISKKGKDESNFDQNSNVEKNNQSKFLTKNPKKHSHNY